MQLLAAHFLVTLKISRNGWGVGEKFTKFADENPRVIRGVVGLAAGLAILKLGLMGVGSAISIVSRIMSMTPIGMIATAIATAAGLIITNWDVVGPYFKKLWETIGPYFETGWELLKKVLHGRRWGW